MSQRIDVHQAITDRIIEAIDKGAGEFKLPWHRPAGSITRPTNIESKKSYRGINTPTLPCSKRSNMPSTSLNLSATSKDRLVTPWVEAQIKDYATSVWPVLEKPEVVALSHISGSTC